MVRLVWDDFDVQQNVEYPMFKIHSWSIGQCEMTNSLIASNSCLSGTIKLVRRLGYYVIRYYTLSFLSVIVTFVGFFMPVNAWPARVCSQINYEYKTK